jgi:hypothetical protein
VALRGRFQNGIFVALQGNGMVYVNQTRPYCVNQMGKTQSKPLAERHGMCESALRRLIGSGDVQLRSFLASTLHCNCQHLIPAASPIGKGPWHPLNWKLAGPQRTAHGTQTESSRNELSCLVYYLHCLTLEDGTVRLSRNVSN